MERIRNLDRYQKGVLILLLAMLVIFAAVYFVVTSRVGYLYNDTILVPSEENGNILYTGRINGDQAVFTVTPDKAVTFRYGEKEYGPYTVKEDPTAVPEGEQLSEYMTGIEIRDGEEIFFRGGALKSGGDDGYWMIFDEDGSSDISITIHAVDGTLTDVHGNPIDPLEPSVGDILDLMEGPKLTSKGLWPIYFLCVVFSIFAAVSILFADELFRWNLRYQIRNADMAEPSDWEIAGRYIGWTAMAGAILVGYIMGLQ